MHNVCHQEGSVMSLKKLTKYHLKSDRDQFENFNLIQYFALSSIGFFILLTILSGSVRVTGSWKEEFSA